MKNVDLGGLQKMFEDLVGNKNSQRQKHVGGVCPQCQSNHTWIYPKIKTKAWAIVYFHCPDCGYRWAIGV